jgi:hypothetical protein
MAAKFLVMDFKVGHRSAKLAAPPVSAQHSFAQFLVLVFFESDR